MYIRAKINGLVGSPLLPPQIRLAQEYFNMALNILRVT